MSDGSMEVDPLEPPPPRVIEDNSQRAARGLRPKGLHTKHLTALERFRVRTLYYDAGLSRDRVHQITGYSKNQIRTAVRAKSAAVGRRPGRPKKNGTATLSGAEPPTSNSSDADAELIQQAQTALAREGYMLMGGYVDRNTNGAEKGSEEEDEGDADADEEDDDDENDRLRPDVSASSATTLVPAADPQAAAFAGLNYVMPPYRWSRSFDELPSEVRLSIWRCVLSTSETQTPPSRSWAIAVLPHEPWLELGISPPEIKLDNPPWGHYVERRHIPAMILSRVNREARSTVLERCTPIMVSRAIRESSKGSPTFIWIDRFSDVMHFFGEPFRPELFEMAGRCACPELYRVTADPEPEPVEEES